MHVAGFNEYSIFTKGSCVMRKAYCYFQLMIYPCGTFIYNLFRPEGTEKNLLLFSTDDIFLRNIYMQSASPRRDGKKFIVIFNR